MSDCETDKRGESANGTAKDCYKDHNELQSFCLESENELIQDLCGVNQEGGSLIERCVAIMKKFDVEKLPHGFMHKLVETSLQPWVENSEFVDSKWVACVKAARGMAVLF